MALGVDFDMSNPDKPNFKVLAPVQRKQVMGNENED